MTVAASESIFAFGPQSAKGSWASTYYRHKASRVNVGPQQVIRQFPPEIGGGFHPTGAYKQMAFGSGQAIMNPRLENVVGWLMYAACGKISDVEDTPEAGMYRHILTPPDHTYDMPWMSLRRLIPGATGTSDNLGEPLLDCRCVGMRLACAPGAILTSAFTFVGREPKLSETGVDSWTWGNTYETYPSVPLAHQGSLKIGGSENKATNLVIDLVNSYTSPQEELIIGSPYPDSASTCFRSASVGSKAGRPAFSRAPPVPGRAPPWFFVVGFSSSFVLRVAICYLAVLVFLKRSCRIFGTALFQSIL